MQMLALSCRDAGRNDEALRLRGEVLKLSRKVLWRGAPRHAHRDAQPEIFEPESTPRFFLRARLP